MIKKDDLPSSPHRPCKMTDEVAATAVPDPENPKCSDFFYRCGNGFLSKSPKFVKDQLTNQAPPQITDIEGGVERTCFLITIFQMIITAVYLCEIFFSLISVWI